MGKAGTATDIPGGDTGTSRVGLCSNCRHTEAIRSKRGSLFYLCRLSHTDSRFPKYPTLPVLACEGHEPVDECDRRLS
jgi:hypothetical protein